MIKNKRKLIRRLGSLILFIAVFFLFQKVWKNRVWISEREFGKELWLILFLGPILYAINYFSLTRAWFKLLVWFGQEKATYKVSHTVYARTQIAKYFPGNIFHYAGRQVLGNQIGYHHSPLAGASLFEVVGVLVVSSAISLSGAMFLGLHNERFTTFKFACIFSIFFLFPFFVNFLISKSEFLKTKIQIPPKRNREIIFGLYPIYFYYLFFFFVMGIILLFITETISPIKDFHQIALIITSFAFAWIAGYITPGSPAGIGIREALIVFSLSKFLGEPESLYIAFILRIVTLLGDFVFFLISFSVRLEPLIENNKKQKLNENQIS